MKQRETQVRTPPNDTADLGPSPPRPPLGKDHQPERRCILSGECAPKSALVRLALGPDGLVAPDVRARAPGRGAWIGVRRSTLEIAVGKGKLKAALNRAYKTNNVNFSPMLPAQIEAALERNALDRMGLEARAGTLLTGSEKIAKAARGGQVYMLLHACDAAVDGRAKLDQAWRVGCDEQGSGKTGLVLSATRAMLSAAMGRENIVHIAITERGAAARIGEALDRWHNFIGRGSGDVPCENASQGSGPLIPSLGAEHMNEGF